MSTLEHGQPADYYVPDQDEHDASYSRLLRSSSNSGSSGSVVNPPFVPRTHTQSSRLGRTQHADRDAVNMSLRFTESGSRSSLHDRH